MACVISLPTMYVIAAVLNLDAHATRTLLFALHGVAYISATRDAVRKSQIALENVKNAALLGSSVTQSKRVSA